MKWALKQGIGLGTLSPFARKSEANRSVDVCVVVAVTGMLAVHTNTIMFYLSHLISSIHPGTHLMLRRHFSLLIPLIQLFLSLFLHFASYTPQD
ncbi:hypothetical protein VNO80_29552 [Phaseolus coccineus]|uniref:Uncharacterized protein n=1 Tax=Phaseolus coccineus TaxID=3886 RepID=A0AAN9LE39_PHACN